MANRFIKEKQQPNLLDQYLRPEKIKYNNSDVLQNYKQIIEKKKTEKFILEKDVKGKENLENTIVIKNTPYKTIIKDRDGVKINNASDMIVHKVSGKDKEGVKNALTALEKTINDLNELNKKTYPPEKKHIYVSDFEQKQKIVLNNTGIVSTGLDLKEENIDFYKRQQAEQEKGIQRKDLILKSINDAQIYSEGELL